MCVQLLVCFWFPRLRGLPSFRSESAKLGIFLNSKTVYEKEIDLQKKDLKRLLLFKLNCEPTTGFYF